MEVNLDAWHLWLETCTQTRVNGGLDYSEVRETAKRLEIDLSPGMWKKIRAMETTVFHGSNGSGNKEDAGLD